MISDKKYEELIDYAFREQELTEKEAIEKWIHSSEENKDLFLSTYREIVFTQWSLASGEIDKEKEFLKFKRKMRRLENRRFYFSLAASALLILGASIYLLFWNKMETKPVSYAKHTVKYGKKGANLILSTGEQLNLNAAFSRAEEEDGTLIGVDSVAGLVYDITEQFDNKPVYNTLKVPVGNEFQLMLSDGTKVWLNAASELKYPIRFTNNIREVYLKGEAYFEVSHDSTRTFVVHTVKQEVRVYGTSFCVNAYNEELIETVLVSGSVGLKIKGKDEEVRLNPGELAVASISDSSISVNSVNLRAYISWKDGDFVFDNESLGNIMQRVQRWYDVKVHYANEEAKEYRFTGDIKRYSDIADLLYFIEKTSDAKFDIQGNTIVVKSKKKTS